MNARACWLLLCCVAVGCGPAARSTPTEPLPLAAMEVAPSREVDAALAEDDYLSWDKLIKTPQGLYVPQELLPELLRGWAEGLPSCEIEELWTRDSDGSGLRSVTLSGLNVRTQIDELLRQGDWQEVPLSDEEQDELSLERKVTAGRVTITQKSWGATITVPGNFPTVPAWAAAQGVSRLVHMFDEALGSPPAAELLLSCQLRGACLAVYESSHPLPVSREDLVRSWGLSTEGPASPWHVWTGIVDGIHTRLVFTQFAKERAYVAFDLKQQDGIANPTCYQAGSDDED